MFYVEILVAGPCETVKPRVDDFLKRVKRLETAAKVLSRVPKVGLVFKRVSSVLKKPVDLLEDLQGKPILSI